MPKTARGPHHSAPCAHPTASGDPCPNRARHTHPEYGPVCALHYHHHTTREDRTATILVRLSPQEKTAVEIAAQVLQVSLSDLGRTMLLGLDLPAPPPPRVHAETHRELGRVGGNLNQVSHSLNRLTAFEDVQIAPAVLHDLARQVADLRAVIQRLQVDLAGGAS